MDDIEYLNIGEIFNGEDEGSLYSNQINYQIQLHKNKNFINL